MSTSHRYFSALLTLILVEQGRRHLLCSAPELLEARKDLRLAAAALAHEKGLTLVPLKVYFTQRGVAKVLLGLCRGKKMHDKRETMKQADAKRDIARAMRRE